MAQTQICAHRGCSAVAPENTLAAFQMAIESGADGIELDVHLTRDGEIVVLHDETVDRTSDGTGWVKDLELSEIKRLDSGRWFSEKYRGETIPTLSEVLELVRETNLWINIELKNNIVIYPRMEELVVEAVERYGLQDRVILSSFNHHSLRHLKLYRPGLELAALFGAGLYEPWVYAEHLGVDAIHPYYPAVTDEMIAGCHARGIRVRPYTVDDRKQMERLISANADAIITNFPHRLRELVGP
ncbi:glycerophosphodiester phosphodiesterase [Lihuaxuella thermophila]|uniref:Glycerophosphoryl diester phosphodiesterase n=1 Tax=Lihuaxuella thermophila TaxID=1173111 RepID=A0A1H8DKG7_9BACL|nr:glycerophosphodiester phosphodiesterase [Lihuaxuella thermophila]SEN07769.1 glycerophosphoryl diester phosphodiesterase [Lihuaxuella thermophila]